MYGLVSLLSEEYDQTVREIWRELEAEFGVHGVHKTPVPHFSYHVAEGYTQTALEDQLKPILVETTSFTVTTSGLGLFTGIDPVLYVAMQPNKKILQLNSRLWQTLSPVCQEAHPLYQPERWVPHITLTQGDIGNERMPDVIRLLSSRNFYWEFNVDNFVLLGSDEGEIDDVHLRFRFQDFD